MTAAIGSPCFLPLAPNPGIAIPAGQIKKPAFDLSEETRRDETVCEDSGPTRYGLEAGIRPFVNIMF